MIRRDRGLNLNTNWIFLNRNACRNTRITSLAVYRVFISMRLSLQYLLLYNPQGRYKKIELFLHSASNKLVQKGDMTEN